MKFPIFKMLIECELFEKYITYRSSRMLWWYSFNNETFYHQFYIDKEVRNFICLNSDKMKKELYSKTIIKKISITFDNYYYIMSPRHRREQPRRVSESILVKHISRLDDVEKQNKYSFLSHIYGLFSMDDVTRYRVNHADDYLNR